MPPQDDLSLLQRARERLYSPKGFEIKPQNSLESRERSLPHEWEKEPLQAAKVLSSAGPRHVRLASLFLIGASVFFVLALFIAGYLVYFGGNSVSVNNISVVMQGPTTIAGGDTVPLTLAITNRNPVTIEDAVLEIAFPEGTRNADNVLKPYPRYLETIGTLRSGETITRSIRAVVFGGAGENLELPVSLSFGAPGTNAVFVKKASYALAVSSTPLSLSVETLAETVSGKPLTVTLTVRSNAQVPLSNVVVAGALPFGFAVQSSSVPMSGSAFLLGTLNPGATKTITLSGTLSGQNSETRVFRFTLGTANTPGDTAIAVTYMTQDATVAIAAPFLTTSLSLGGKPLNNAVISAGTQQTVTLTYANTLATSITNATIAIALSGGAIDYNSIRTTTGFYRSSDRTIVFSRDTDPSFTSLAPGASGIGTFSFTTLPASSAGRSPQLSFTISVSGTRVGQANVPETVSASSVQTAKVATSVGLSALALRNSGPFTNTGPIPPRADEPTTYTIQWSLTNPGSAIGGSSVSATLPGYVTYTGKTSGNGSISYDSSARRVTWNAGDLPQGGSAQAAFQVSLTPSSSQKGSAPRLTESALFSGFDRFAGIQVSASAEALTTETSSDPGYSSTNATVQ